MSFEPKLLDDRSFEYAPDQRIVQVHDSEACQGRHCVIHNPSDHCMRSFPLHWRQHMPLFDIKPSHFERICPHGVGHPDPDDMEFWTEIGEESMGVHGCDGCCSEPCGLPLDAKAAIARRTRRSTSTCELPVRGAEEEIAPEGGS